jgi:5-methylcytosine-specific restriction enzyme subunit McrC
VAITIRRETIDESKDTPINLTAEQAHDLSEIGKRLASRKHWWGEDEGEQQEQRTAINVRHESGQKWQVRVANAVGVITLNGLQIVVRPKIPMPHLLYLLGLSGQFPKIDEYRASVALGEDLWPVVASWFVSAAEAVLRRDLVRDYEEINEELRVIRGTVDLRSLTTAVYRGTLEFSCDFDEFTVDTALNRLLRGAARVVASSQTLDLSLRRRGQAVSNRMTEVADVRSTDFSAVVDRQSGHYVDAVALARHVLLGEGRVIEHGEAPGRTFLVPTPLMVEEAVRRILAEALRPEWDVRKQGIQSRGGEMRFNPDLVFNQQLAVGDVKYKLAPSSWGDRRADIDQLTTFAAARFTQRGCIVTFRRPGSPALADLRFGAVRIRELCWDADDSVKPTESARRLVERARSWLRELEAEPTAA